MSDRPTEGNLPIPTPLPPPPLPPRRGRRRRHPNTVIPLNFLPPPPFSAVPPTTQHPIIASHHQSGWKGDRERGGGEEGRLINACKILFIHPHPPIPIIPSSLSPLQYKSNTRCRREKKTLRKVRRQGYQAMEEQSRISCIPLPLPLPLPTLPDPYPGVNTLSFTVLSAPPPYFIPPTHYFISFSNKKKYIYMIKQHTYRVLPCCVRHPNTHPLSPPFPLPLPLSPSPNSQT